MKTIYEDGTFTIVQTDKAYYLFEEDEMIGSFSNEQQARTALKNRESQIEFISNSHTYAN